jgi:hypothetical protein
MSKFGALGQTCSSLLPDTFSAAYHKYHNFYGQRGARLESDKSVYNNRPPHRCMVMSISSFLLLRAPENHLQRLSTVYVDQILNDISWKKLVGQVITEWQEVTLFVCFHPLGFSII